MSLLPDNERVLLGPGPSMTSPRVMRAMAAPTVSHLDPVLRNWSNRNGLKAKVDGYQRAQKDEAIQEALLAELPAIERRHPDEALDKIRSVTPTPHTSAPRRRILSIPMSFMSHPFA